MDEGRWQVVLDSLQSGDYVIIQFGHNDQKPYLAHHTDAFTTYKSNLEAFVKDTRRGNLPPQHGAANHSSTACEGRGSSSLDVESDFCVIRSF